MGEILVLSDHFAGPPRAETLRHSGSPTGALDPADGMPLVAAQGERGPVA